MKLQIIKKFDLRIANTLRIKRYYLLIFLITSLSLLVLTIFRVDDIWATETDKLPTYMVSTRGNQEYPQEDVGPGYNNKYNYSKIEKLYESCPPEVVFFVHGWHNDHEKAKERLDRVKLSLEFNIYNISLIGFSWDSNVEWDHAKIIAEANGPRLAQFILDYVEWCKYEKNKDVDVRLVGHSLGSRVILSTLQSLHNNPIWNNSTNNFKILSVHLMGAAVDDEEVSISDIDISNDFTNQGTVKSAYGGAIQDEVSRFYNLFSTQDNILEFIYPFFEKDTALGKEGKQEGIEEISSPPYFDINVTDEILRISNADGLDDIHYYFCGFFLCETDLQNWDSGLCSPFFFSLVCNVETGDNHAGYIGFRNSENTSKLLDDGAMRMVVENWRNPEN